MNDKSGHFSSDIKEQSLEKYSNKEEVTKKWVSLYKRLNPKKNSREYNAIIIEAISISELALQNNLEGDYIEGRFIDNLNRLIEKGCPISTGEFNKLKRIKWYRNMVAHNTETVVQKIINYESSKDTFFTIGTLLYRLGLLSEEDILPSYKKLQANLGDVIGETCVLRELLGQGGSGRVFKAYHKRLDLTVAVKEIAHELIDSIDVENEKNMLLSLRHDGIPRMYDIIEDNQTYYLIMDYIEGQTLKDYIEKMGSLPVNAVSRLTRELCSIMSYLHNFRDGIIFRDLKPENIILDKETHVHLIDFGISRRVDAKESGQPVSSGTAYYSSPEQLNGYICDKRSDIYSLGAVVYFMIEGHNPVENGEQSYKRSTPEKLINIIEKAMSMDKEERYNCVEALILDIDNLHKELNGNIVNANTNTQLVYNQLSSNNGQVALDKQPPASVQYNRAKKLKPWNWALVIVLGMLLLMIGSIVYTLNRNANDQYNRNIESTDTLSSDIASTSVLAASDQVSQAQTSSTSEPSQSKSSEAKASDKQNSDAKVQEDVSTTAFKGKAVLTVKSYKIDGTDLIVNGVIENNYSKEFTISPYDVYVMGDDGNKNPLDVMKFLSSGNNSLNIVPGEKHEFELIFSDYTDSNSLTFNVSKIYCDFTNASFSLKLK